jgi:conjugative relaxase-like TrwC/TraI family protein
MTASSIPAARGGVYARYLESKTVEPERGDYYLTPDGEMTQAPGRWLASGETLERLGVQDGEPVAGEDFIALMEGRHPGNGEWLRPEGAGGGRSGGIDVTFSAPKSVSVVWALGDTWQREQIEAAHARAVEQAVLYLRERVPLVRRRRDGLVIEEHARDVIAAEYRHTTARGVAGSQAPDPQLHSHVVITGVVREDERIVAVASRPVFRSAREVGAFYRSALAGELAAEDTRSNRAPAKTAATSRSPEYPGR